MINNIKSAGKNSLIYGLGNLSTKLVGFILLPLYTKNLTVSDYGILSILEITSQFIISIFGLSLYQAFNRWYWDKKYRNRQKSIFFTTFISLFFISGFMIFILSCFSNNLSMLLFGKTDFSYVIKIMITTSGLQIISVLPKTLMKLQEKSIFYSFSNLIRFIVNLLFTVYFVAFLKKNVEGIYLAQLIGTIIFFAILSRYIIKNFKFKVELTVLKEMFLYSFPLMFASLSGIVLSVADRFCLNYLGGLSDVGEYSLGFKIANTIKVLVITSVQLAINPMIYKMIGQKGNKRFYSKIMTYFCFGVMIFVLGLSVFGKEVIKVLASSNKNYWEAYKVIPIISFAILFGMLKDTSLIGLNIAKKTRIIAITMTIISVFNIALNIVLIPHFQSIGAAIATLISQAIFFIAIFKIAQKYYYIPYEISKIIKMIILGFILFGLSLLINNFSLVFRVLLKLSIIGTFPIILYFWNFYEDIELLRLKQSWHKWKNPGKWKENISKNKVH